MRTSISFPLEVGKLKGPSSSVFDNCVIELGTELFFPGRCSEEKPINMVISSEA